MSYKLYVYILDTLYTVLIGERDEIQFYDKELIGECQTYGKKILIVHDNWEGEKQLTDFERDVRTTEVIIHEVTHAFLHESGIQTGDSYSEEAVCCFLEVNMVKIMKVVKGILDILGIDDLVMHSSNQVVFSESKY